MPLVPAIVVQAIQAAIRSLSGPALVRFASAASSRLGMQISGSAAMMANQVGQYIAQNPMSAGLAIASMAAASVGFDHKRIIELWEQSGDLPEDVKYLVEQVEEVSKRRSEITGDGEEGTVMGLDVDDLRKAAKVLALGDAQINLLIDQFGDIDTVIGVRNALFAVDDEQLQLFKERQRA